MAALEKSSALSRIWGSTPDDAGARMNGIHYEAVEINYVIEDKAERLNTFGFYNYFEKFSKRRIDYGTYEKSFLYLQN